MTYKKNNNSFDLREMPQEDLVDLMVNIFGHFKNNKKLNLVVRKNKINKKPNLINIKLLNDKIK